jgi:hypothetical protein
MKHIGRLSMVALLTMMTFVVSAARTEAVVLVAAVDNVPVELAPGFFGGDQLASSYDGTMIPLSLQWTGTLASAVYRNAGGTLDFYYQISNTTVGEPDTLTRSTHVDFGGFEADVFYFLTPGSLLACAACPGGTFADGTEDPDLADRLSDSSIGFDFTPDAEGVEPGEISLVYVIRTNATAFISGFSGMSNGGQDETITFQPTIGTVPEPGSLGLFALGLLASAASLRRRWIR